MSPLKMEDVKKYVGQEIYALKKDGTIVAGKLLRIRGKHLILSANKSRKVKTKAVIPLVLFDLLAIGTAPYAYGGYPGYGYGFGGYGYGGYGGYGGGFGYPGFFI